MAAPPALHTPRLVLQPLTAAVARAVVTGADPGVDPARGWPLAETADALRLFGEHGGETDDGGWLVVLRADGRVIGDCGWRGGPGPDGTAEISYGIAEPYRGQGYGREAVEAMVQWCAGQPRTRRLAADVRCDNVASRRLVERLGFRLTSVTETDAYYVRES